MDNLTVTKGAVIRTVVLVIALVNQVLTSIGYPVLPFTDEQVTELITLAFTIGASAWAWWKNNSFTKHAIKADEIKNELKDSDWEV